MGIGTLWPNQLCVGANYMATDLMQAFNTMLEDVLTNVSYLFPFFFPQFLDALFLESSLCTVKHIV